MFVILASSCHRVIYQAWKLNRRYAQIMNRFLVSLIPFLLFASCGTEETKLGEPEKLSVSQASTTSSPTVIATSTPTVIATSTPTVIATSTPTVIATSVEPSVICVLDSERRRVSCETDGYQSEARLSWASNATSATQGGPTWSFLVESTPIPTIITVDLEVCIEEECERVATQLDGTAIAQHNQTGQAIGSSQATHGDHSTSANEWSMQYQYSRNKCDPDGPVMLTSPPVDVSTISMVEPMGGVSYDHITPIDHLYFFHVPDNLWEIYSMSDGHIVYLAWNDSTQYRMVVEHSCHLYSIYIHIQELPEDLESALGLSRADRNKDLRIYPRMPVKSGDLLGYDIVNGRGSLDISIVDTRVELDGFVNIESYKEEFWKKHCVDPFNYWQGSFSEQILSRTLVVNDNPPGGKIDHDIAGTLIGNWFLENSGGYAGTKGVPGDRHGSSGHLYFGPSNMVPNTYLVSMGAFAQKKSFHLEEDAPNPADVNAESGIIKYGYRALNQGDSGQLTGYRVVQTGDEWDGRTFPLGGALEAVYRPGLNGVILVEVLSDRSIKIEAFQDARSLDEVTGFTEDAKTYVR